MAVNEKEQYFYRQVDRIHIPTTRWRKIEGEEIEPRFDLEPFNPNKWAPFAYVTTDTDSVDNKYPKLVQTSLHHKRSFELRFNESGMIIWEDLFGQLYGALNIKGVNVSNPRARSNTDAPSGFVFWGLLDSDSILRQKRASDELRVRGIETEVTLRVLEPNLLPAGEERINIDELKHRMLMKVWDENKQFENPTDIMGDVSRLQLPDLAKALDNMTFFITVRSLQVSERLLDLAEVRDKEELSALLDRVFKFVNLKEEILARRLTRYLSVTDEPEKPFDPNSEEDIFRYLTEYLPYRLGRNYGLLHAAGLLHKFPHLQNVSLVGSIYDLDSIVGKPLNVSDEPVTEDDIRNELNYLLFGDENHSLAGGAVNVIASLQNRGLILKEENAARVFKMSFFMMYIKNRGWEQNVLAHLEDIFGFYQGFQQEHEELLEGYYLDLAKEQIDWDYDFTHNFPFLVKHLFQEDTAYWQNEEGDIFEQALEDGTLHFRALGRIFNNQAGRAYIKTLFDYERGEELTEIENKYGEMAKRLLAIMFVNRAYEQAQELLIKLDSGGLLDTLMQYGIEGNFKRAVEGFWVHQYFLAQGWVHISLEEILEAKGLLDLYREVKAGAR